MTPMRLALTPSSKRSGLFSPPRRAIIPTPKKQNQRESGLLSPIHAVSSRLSQTFLASPAPKPSFLSPSARRKRSPSLSNSRATSHSLESVNIKARNGPGSMHCQSPLFDLELDESLEKLMEAHNKTVEDEQSQLQKLISSHNQRFINSASGSSDDILERSSVETLLAEHNQRFYQKENSVAHVRKTAKIQSSEATSDFVKSKRPPAQCIESESTRRKKDVAKIYLEIENELHDSVDDQATAFVPTRQRKSSVLLSESASALKKVSSSKNASVLQSSKAVNSAASGPSRSSKASVNAALKLDADDDVFALLQQHNSKLRSARIFYEPAKFSAKIVRKWEQMNGKKWHSLNPSEREVANSEMARL